MEQRHQKNENPWNSREELTGKNLTQLGTEPGKFGTAPRQLSYHPVLASVCNKGTTVGEFMD